MALTFSTFSTFLDAVKSLTSNELDEAITVLNGVGKEIDISDLFISDSNEFFDVLPDGTLARVNLYIPQRNIQNNSLSTMKIADLNKYHIYKCGALKELFEEGRRGDFKVNSRDDGTFHYSFISYGKLVKTETHQKLNICKWCLSIFLKKRCFDNDVEKFNLKKFYEQNTSFFDFDTSSLEKGEDANINVYHEKWREISEQIKTKYDYTCQECGWRPSIVYRQRFIHTHHQNRDKTNNNKDNLRVLCIKCHSEVDEHHTHIKNKEAYKEFLKL